MVRGEWVDEKGVECVSVVQNVCRDGCLVPVEKDGPNEETRRGADSSASSDGVGSGGVSGRGGLESGHSEIKGQSVESKLRTRDLVGHGDLGGGKRRGV